jgi:hypothetical protein
MALRDRLFDSEAVATATPATVAMPEPEKSVTVARVATVAAKPENSKRTNRLRRMNRLKQFEDHSFGTASTMVYVTRALVSALSAKGIYERTRALAVVGKDVLRPLH